MIIIYNFIMMILWPVIWLYLNHRKKIGKENIERFNERIGEYKTLRPKGDLIRSSCEEVYGIQLDTIYRLSCLAAHGTYTINHLTRLDACKWYIIALIDPEEITLLKISKDRLWELKHINQQRGSIDKDFILTKSQIMDLDPEILTHL